MRYSSQIGSRLEYPLKRTHLVVWVVLKLRGVEEEQIREQDHGQEHHERRLSVHRADKGMALATYSIGRAGRKKISQTHKRERDADTHPRHPGVVRRAERDEDEKNNDQQLQLLAVVGEPHDGDWASAAGRWRMREGEDDGALAFLTVLCVSVEALSHRKTAGGNETTLIG